MSFLTVPFTYSAGAVIIASQLNSCNSTIYSDYNGNIQDVNIASGAAISYVKLSLSGSIVNADISASAGIADSKLSQITTASKVSGAAITLLTSLPLGAGVIPTANLGSGTANSSSVLFGDQTYKSGSSIGGVTLVSNTVVSAAATTGNIAITNTNHYKVRGVLYPISADDIIWLRFNNSANANYNYAFTGYKSSAASVQGGAASATKIVLGNTVKSLANGTQAGFRFELDIFPQGTDNTPQISQQVIKGQAEYTNSAGDLEMISFGGFGMQAINTVNTSFSILTAAGATVSGNVYLYQMATT